MVTIYGSRGFTFLDLPNPDLVLGWDTVRPSQSVVHRIPNQATPVITLHPHGPREGTLRLFYRSQADAHEAAEALAQLGYGWTIDTSNPPTSVRTNRMTNPSFEGGTTGWSAVAATGGVATIGVATDSPPVGMLHGRVSWSTPPTGGFPGAVSPWCPMPGLAGEWIAGAVLLRASSPFLVRTALQVRSAGGTTIATIDGTEQSSNGQWVRAVASLQVPANFANARLYTHSASGAGITTFDIDAAMIAQGATQAEALAQIDGYFDGNTADVVTGTNTIDYAWAGTSHASASTETITPVPDAPGGSMAFYATGDVRVSSVGDNDRPWVVEVGYTEVLT